MQTASFQISLNRRVALYARDSLASDHKNGLEVQIRALRSYCEQNKIEHYELFTDQSRSGTKGSRPSLDRMMKAVEDGEIEVVIVFSFSRYAKSASHFLRNLEVLKKFQTNFVSLEELLDLSTTLGQIALTTISAIAQIERDTKVERIKNGQTVSRARGQRLGRARTRNSALIESLLEVGYSYRDISKLVKCSQGSIRTQKLELQIKKELAEQKRISDLAPKTPENIQVAMGGVGYD